MQNDKFAPDLRLMSEITHARDVIAVQLYGRVVEGVIAGRINKPLKSDGSAMNPYFRAALAARNFADALLRALDDRPNETPAVDPQNASTSPSPHGDC